VPVGAGVTIRVLPGVVWPMAVGFQTDEIRRYLSFPRDETTLGGLTSKESQ
jgi:hypothetical protein